MAKNVLVTGGAGYAGCVLVPKMLEKGYKVTVYDIMCFGSEGLPTHPSLKVVEGDIRDVNHLAKHLPGIDTVLHLACISNDPSFELDPEMSKTVNYDCFEPLVATCKKAGVSRFVYASSSSVYGVSDSPEVTEDHPLVPLTDYNKYKGMCEPILRRYQSDDFTTVTIRPATLCGYSPRQRLDLTVNILTNHAVNKGLITVFGGDQKRPNLHVDDMADVYLMLLEIAKEKIAGETFNAGYQNHSVRDLALMTKKIVEQEMPHLGNIELKYTDSNDPRSYHISSDKIGRLLGFYPKRSVEDAVRDLCRAFAAGKLPNSFDDNRYFNVRTVKNEGLSKRRAA